MSERATEYLREWQEKEREATAEFWLEENDETGFYQIMVREPDEPLDEQDFAMADVHSYAQGVALMDAIDRSNPAAVDELIECVLAMREAFVAIGECGLLDGCSECNDAKNQALLLYDNLGDPGA